MHKRLKATPRPWQLWIITIGFVSAREYLGWSHNWASSGTLSLIMTTLAAIVPHRRLQTLESATAA